MTKTTGNDAKKRLSAVLRSVVPLSLNLNLKTKQKISDSVWTRLSVFSIGFKIQPTGLLLFHFLEYGYPEHQN